MRQRRELTPDEAQRIRAMYLSGEKLEYIALTTDRHERTISKMRDRLGLPKRRPPVARSPENCPAL